MFAVVCVALAFGHQRYKLEPASIALVLLAALPWVVPWIGPLISSLKFGGLELNFRELKAQIEENTKMTQATAAAVMPVVQQSAVAAKAEAAASSEFVSHGVPLGGTPQQEAEDGDDPNKGRFGGSRERNGYRLDAEVTPMPQSTNYFLVHAWVEATGRRPLPDGKEVVFHLHPTFPQPVVTVKSSGGVASLDRLAWGAFTLGAEVEGVRLELDLATEISSPKNFRDR